MQKTRLLLVDDDAVTRLAVSSCFRSNPHIALVAVDSAEKVLHLLDAGEQFDCLIVDWNMPGMNGYELVCAVRANPLYAAVKILMLTAETSMDHIQSALNAGADEYLMKPFTKELLLGKLSLIHLT